MTFSFGHMELGTKRPAKVNIGMVIALSFVLFMLVFSRKYLYLLRLAVSLRYQRQAFKELWSHVVCVTINNNFPINFLVQS